MNIEHFDCLSWFSQGGAKAMSKTARDCRSQRRCESKQRPAILPWPSGLFRDIDGSLPVVKSAELLCRANGGSVFALSPTREKKPARKLISGGYPAARSTLCNVLRWCAEGNRESDGA